MVYFIRLLKSSWNYTPSKIGCPQFNWVRFKHISSQFKSQDSGLDVGVWHFREGIVPVQPRDHLLGMLTLRGWGWSSLQAFLGRWVRVWLSLDLDSLNHNGSISSVRISKVSSNSELKFHFPPLFHVLMPKGKMDIIHFIKRLLFIHPP